MWVKILKGNTSCRSFSPAKCDVISIVSINSSRCLENSISLTCEDNRQRHTLISIHRICFRKQRFLQRNRAVWNRISFVSDHVSCLFLFYLNRHYHFMMPFDVAFQINGNHWRSENQTWYRKFSIKGWNDRKNSWVQKVSVFGYCSKGTIFIRWGSQHLSRCNKRKKIDSRVLMTRNSWRTHQDANRQVHIDAASPIDGGEGIHRARKGWHLLPFRRQDNEFQRGVPKYDLTNTHVARNTEIW